jgi:RNA polymerase sigma-70 factor, ECF subfamily
MTPDSPQSSEHSDAFDGSRRRLWQVAYRMLGSRAEADDVVQEAYLRWHDTPIEDIRTPQAWLVTTVTRLAIDRLRQLRTERELYVGPWLPEPIVTGTAPPADHELELASELSVAFLAILERLAPEERAAFLLHELFEVDYGEIAQVLGKSATTCRQIVSRARKRVRAERPRVKVNPDATARLLDGFVRAVKTRDKAAMLTLLAEDATWTSDGGGKATAALRVIQGAERVAKFAVGVYKGSVEHLDFRHVLVNGEPGLAVVYEDQVATVMAVRTDGRRILDIYAVRNPDKLRHVAL